MKNTKIIGYKVVVDYDCFQYEVMYADTIAQAFKYLRECKNLGAEYITIKMRTRSKKFFSAICPAVSRILITMM